MNEITYIGSASGIFATALDKGLKLGEAGGSASPLFIYCSVYCSVLLFRLLFRFVRNSLTVNNSTVPFTVRFYCSLLHRSQLYPKGVILRRFKRFYIRCSVAVHRNGESVLESVFWALSLIYHIGQTFAPITLNPYDAHICVLRR